MQLNKRNIKKEGSSILKISFILAITIRKHKKRKKYIINRVKKETAIKSPEGAIDCTILSRMW